MEDELKVFLDENKTDLVELETKPFRILQFRNHLIALSGIGLINAGACASYIAAKYSPTSFFNIGLAGAPTNAKVEILQPLIISNVYHGGVDAQVFGYEYGQTPKEPVTFVSDKNLIEKLQLQTNYELGMLASSDSFVGSLALYETFIAPLKKEISLIDMEAFGYYQIATKFNLPIISLKIVSDILNKHGDNDKQFIEILAQGSQIIAQVMVKYLK
ncbi:hypothetical protein Zmor_019142 [Zophobas morio]|uniref:Nucleoside phosphorylase domain-containing protein n=1 Tax=Zophobas morio TaxID=2755281 RepID=A0AA38HJT3_9CUCU|nr:hypothetical protein Zmor_019142 [Zophobas morio]